MNAPPRRTPFARDSVPGTAVASTLLLPSAPPSAGAGDAAMLCPSDAGAGDVHAALPPRPPVTPTKKHASAASTHSWDRRPPRPRHLTIAAAASAPAIDSPRRAHSTARRSSPASKAAAGCARLYCPSARAAISVLLAAAFVSALALLIVPQLALFQPPLPADASVAGAAVSTRRAHALSMAPAVPSPSSFPSSAISRSPFSSQAEPNNNNSSHDKIAYNYGVDKLSGHTLSVGLDEQRSGIVKNDEHKTEIEAREARLTNVRQSASKSEIRVEKEKEDGAELHKGGQQDPADFSTFSGRTALNYFHLHKTGGVSFKERVFNFFFAEGHVKPDGQHAVIFDTCHTSGARHPALGVEAEWSCDWARLEQMSPAQRNAIDVVVGHQYWHRGASHLMPQRDLRYFTVLRHPLHRKVSFYYHFFVRNAGRAEDSVTLRELRDFILARAVPASPLMRDGGPAYYASRLWSDGISGFSSGHQYVGVDMDVGAGVGASAGGMRETEAEALRAEALIRRSVQRLRRHFVFIGLQSQERASLCMLHETVVAFAKAHGITNLTRAEEIAAPRERMNTGAYQLTADALWHRLSPSEREEFKRIEQVDLGIYKEGVQMFHEMVVRFGCAHLVQQVDNEWTAL